MRQYITALALLLLASCGQQKAETKEAEQAEPAATETQSLQGYEYTDTVTAGSHRVVYTITCQPDDELPAVTAEDGTEYKDNRFSLHVIKDGKTLFSRSFSKADFSSQLSKKFLKYGIMDGLQFSHAQEGRLFFNACVSYPDSDMSCPFFLTIGPDGSFSITPDTTTDDDLPPTSDETAE